MMDSGFTDKNVMVANELIMSRYFLTSKQMDLLFIIIANLKKNQLFYSIHINDLEKVTGSEWNYKRLRLDTKELGSKCFEIFNDKGILQLWLFESIQYVIRKGLFEVSISKTAMPYLYDLKGNFTVVELRSIIACKSVYAKRIYCFAMSKLRKNSTCEFEYGIEDLKNQLEINRDTKFEKYSRFREIVLEPAEMEINDKSNINISFEPVKRGRVYTTIRMVITRKRISKKMLPDYVICDLIDYAIVRSYGFNEYQSNQISQKVTKTKFQEIVDIMHRKLASGECPSDKALAFAVGIFQNQGILNRKNEQH